MAETGGLLGNFLNLDNPNKLYGGLLSDEATQRAATRRNGSGARPS